MSYSQKADICNYCNGYPVPFKQCTTLEKEELPSRGSTTDKYECTHTHNAYLSHNACSHVCALDPCFVMLCYLSLGDVLTEWIRLHRHRLESAHLKYAMLNVQNRYPDLLEQPIIVTGEVKKNLMNFTPLFYKAFCSRYSST